MRGVPSTYSPDRLTPLAGGIRDGAHPRGAPPPPCPGSAAGPGFVSLRSARSAPSYWLVDREGRKGLIATFWNNEEAMHASEQSRLKRQEGHSVRSLLAPIVLNNI